MSPPQMSAGHCTVISCALSSSQHRARNTHTHTHALQGAKAVHFQHAVVKVSFCRTGGNQKCFRAAGWGHGVCLDADSVTAQHQAVQEFTELSLKTFLAHQYFCRVNQQERGGEGCAELGLVFGPPCRDSTKKKNTFSTLALCLCLINRFSAAEPSVFDVRSTGKRSSPAFHFHALWTWKPEP